MLGSLLDEYSEERLHELLIIYFSTPRKIYSVPFFKSGLGDLIQLERKIQKEKPSVMPEGENWRFDAGKHNIMEIS